MAATQSHVDSDSGEREISALAQIRLERNWSYQQLADDMAREGCPLSAKTLQNLVIYRPRPFDRTLYQIRQYLKTQKAATR